jgi:CHAD domain-containing protein
MANTSILQSKWIVGTEPDQPVSRVARVALSQRLTVLQTYLRLAAKRADKDDEYVHQLRVSTRRAHAALRMFGSLLPPRRAERMRKQLKRLRRAAGVARDLDVLASRLSRRAETSSDSRLEPVIDRIHEERGQAQKRLVLERKRLKRADFESAAQGMLKRVHWRGSQPEPLFRDVALQSFHTAIDKFLQAATADLSELSLLHEMRLAGKRLRYAMELLAGVFEPAFKSRLYPAVQEIQDKLGHVNDHVTAATLLSQWSAEASVTESGLLAQLAAEERGFAEATRRQFQQWWTPQRIEELRREAARMKVVDPAERRLPVEAGNRGIA